jgi:hypothetical protein
VALYIPAAKRRRRLILLIGAGVVVGLLVGVLVGRLTAPGLSDGIHAAQSRAQRTTGLLESLPTEYEATQQGAQGKSAATFRQSLDQLDADLEAAIAKAKWLGPSARKRLRAAVATVRSADEDGVPSSVFQRTVADAAKVVADEFDLANP